MLLTISTTHQPALDLGYLLAKNPNRLQTFPLTFGKAHVFYPENSKTRCTAALLLELDAVGMVRNRRGEGNSLEQYVNDRPYVSSSFLSVAIAETFGTALSGRSRERQELADTPIPLEANVSTVPCRGGRELLERLFAPLGYEIEATGAPLDPLIPEWGESTYFNLRIRGTVTLKTLLSHLYVIIPVLDNAKHYWVGEDEVQKLLRHGGDWLPNHPEKDLIATRYLRYRRSLIDSALEQLLTPELGAVDEDLEQQAAEEEKVEKPIRLNDARIGAVVAVLKSSGARRVLDLGCGPGQLLRALLPDRSFEKIVGADVSYRTLEIVKERFERLPAMQRARVELLHTSLTYRDARLAGYDAAAIVEVIEHLDPPRLAAFERTVFEFARPRTVVITTPNSEYNVKWETLPAGRFRHRDHRFEWTRAEFQEWANLVAQRFGYGVRFLPIGPDDPEVGSPTQMGIFEEA